MDNIRITDQKDPVKIIVVISIIVIIVFLIISLINNNNNKERSIIKIYSKNNDNDNNKKKNKDIKNEEEENIEETEEDVVYEPKNNKRIVRHVQHIEPEIDVVREYDYRKSYDPLEDPKRRVQRYQIPPYYFRRVIDRPTQGYPDNYNQIGYLQNSELSENKLLRLFGREEFPRSNKWEYYTSLNSGNDMIKIPIKTSKNELFDEDTIKVLNNEYKVKLYKYDSPKYYPDIL